MIRTGPEVRRASSCILLRLLLLVLLSCVPVSSSSPPSSVNINPYEILGVPKSADQSTIRRHYHKLCLKYHPDKNTDRPEAERKRCVEAFKRVQRANDMVGDEEARRRHDRTAAYAGLASRSSRGASPYGSGGGGDVTADDIFREFYGGMRRGGGRYGGSYYGNAYRRRPRSFYVNGVDVSDMIRRFPLARRFFGHPAAAFDTEQERPKSIYVQKVEIPLEDLYAGVDSKILQVHDSVWARYRAAFRGGTVGGIALSAALSTIPLWLRTRFPVAAVAFAVGVHLGLPRPECLMFPTAIKRGWKGGTKIKYKSSPEIGICDIVFVVVEGKNGNYTREGDNLRTTATVGEDEARTGCTIHVEPILGLAELPIVIDLLPGEVQENGYTKVVEGKGWPGRKGRGDLIVDIIIEKSIGGKEVKDANRVNMARQQKQRRRRQRRRPDR